MTGLSLMLMPSVRIPDFLPSTRGFKFSNSWAHVPVLEIKIGDLATIDLGDAANGLCGGMSFTVADAYLAGLPELADLANPDHGSPRFDYIVGRQLDSFAGIAVPLRFYQLMRTSRPDREPAWAGALSWFGVDQHSRAYVMIHDEWPRLQVELDAGRPAMMGLVRTVSDDPRLLGHNHQVMAYGYDLNGPSLTLRIYDPNWPGDDGVVLSLDISDPRSAAAANYSKPDGPLYGFFAAPYTRRDPAPWRMA